MTSGHVAWIESLEALTQALKTAQDRPYGREASPEEERLIGQACLRLCGDDRNKARTMYKLVRKDWGYVPWCVGWTLIRASDTSNLVPDVTAPEPT